MGLTLTLTLTLNLSLTAAFRSGLKQVACVCHVCLRESMFVYLVGDWGLSLKMEQAGPIEAR